MHTPVTFTITGKDLDGNDQTDEITGVNNNTVKVLSFYNSLQIFL